MSEKPLVSSSIVAERYGVSVQTVRRWVRESRIPYLRASRRVVRFRLDEVDRALKHAVEVTQ